MFGSVEGVARTISFPPGGAGHQKEQTPNRSQLLDMWLVCIVHPDSLLAPLVGDSRQPGRVAVRCPTG